MRLSNISHISIYDGFCIRNVAKDRFFQTISLVGKPACWNISSFAFTVNECRNCGGESYYDTYYVNNIIR